MKKAYGRPRKGESDHDILQIRVQSGEIVSIARGLLEGRYSPPKVRRAKVISFAEHERMVANGCVRRNTGEYTSADTEVARVRRLKIKQESMG